MEQLQVKFNKHSSWTPTQNLSMSSYTSPAGTDYTDVTTILTFDATISTQMVTVSILDDHVVEDTEFINLALTSVDNAAMLSSASARINIKDVDSELTNENCKFSFLLGLLIYSRLTAPQAENEIVT